MSLPYSLSLSLSHTHTYTHTHTHTQNIATTVFTPLELGTVGMSEEAAIEKYGNGKRTSFPTS